MNIDRQMANYCLYGQDNESYAFRQTPPPWTKDEKLYAIHQALTPDMSGEPRSELRRCESCGELIDKWNESIAELVVKKRRWDLSHTYDGIKVASAQYKAAYEFAGLLGLEFRQLPHDPEFFVIRPERTVEYDADRRGTRFIKQCSQCNRYESIVGATPVYLKPEVTIGDQEFVSTNLEFGSNDQKSPLLLCGGAAAAALEAANLKGLDFEPIKATASA